MFVRPKIGYVRAKIGLTGQFDRCQPGNYLKSWLGFSYSENEGWPEGKSLPAKLSQANKSVPGML